jgi:hypothetical protein
MRTITTVSFWIIRITGIIQLILGILFWTGHAYTYVPAHMAIGSLLVLALWAIAVVALVAKVRRGLAAFELIWGLALAVFGARQAMFLIGPLHWIVRVVHLAMALSAMQMGGILAKAIFAALPAAARESRREPAAERAS